MLNSKDKDMKIYYMNIMGDWVESNLPVSQKNLLRIRDKKAFKGNAVISDSKPIGK